MPRAVSNGTRRRPWKLAQDGLRPEIFGEVGEGAAFGEHQVGRPVAGDDRAGGDRRLVHRLHAGELEAVTAALVDRLQRADGIAVLAIAILRDLHRAAHVALGRAERLDQAREGDARLELLLALDLDPLAAAGVAASSAEPPATGVALALLLLDHLAQARDVLVDRFDLVSEGVVLLLLGGVEGGAFGRRGVHDLLAARRHWWRAAPR
jgi:hypothetical protein